MPSNCHFQIKWLENPEYKKWLDRGTVESKAKCSMCRKEFDISNMGEAALKSHKKSAKHTEFFNKLSSNFKISKWVKSGPSTSSVPLKSCTLENSVSTNDVIKAEIYWALNTVKNHFSYKSCENMVSVFKNMFPDSDIARKMSLVSLFDCIWTWSIFYGFNEETNKK